MNTGEIQLGELLRKIFFAIKRNIIVFIITILLVVMAGGAYAFMRAPTYTAQNRLHYGVVPTQDNYSANQLTARYFKSIATFCRQGRVADRADFYYSYYLLELEGNPDLTVNEFFTWIERAEALTEVDRYNNPTEYQKYEKYKFDKEILQHYLTEPPHYIKSENIISKTLGGDKEENYTIVVGYTDKNKISAEVKTSFIIEAVKLEANYAIDEDGNPIKYFGDFTINVIDYGPNGATYSDMSKKQIISIAAVLGVALACIVVYLVTISNHTVTEKEEVERITGSNILSYISNKGVR